jgi:hypothetical protein
MLSNKNLRDNGRGCLVGIGKGYFIEPIFERIEQNK